MTDLVKKDRGDLVAAGKGLDFQKMRKGLGLTSVVKEFKDFHRRNALQLLMMFDITGSMFDYFDLVREKLNEIITFVKQKVSGVQFAVFAYRNHGDEINYKQIYYTSPLTSNIDEIRQVIQSIKKGGGGPDALTCMEDCFRKANLLPWEDSAAKAMVVVGDMPPHGVVDSVDRCPNDINYQYEVEQLISKGITAYPVFCGYHKKSRDFFLWLAERTGGRFLEIKEIDLLVDILVGICMKQTGNLKGYINHLQETKQLTPRRGKVLFLLG